jgi:hypothetical protein
MGCQASPLIASTIFAGIRLDNWLLLADLLEGPPYRFLLRALLAGLYLARPLPWDPAAER